jgi:DNA-binding CsgD family transcriptional regulator
MDRTLTKRELEILVLIAKELTTNDISIQLKISASTVESHRRNLLRKTGAKNSVGLITESFKKGWL